MRGGLDGGMRAKGEEERDLTEVVNVGTGNRARTVRGGGWTGRC